MMRLAVLLFFVASGAAAQQPTCAPRETVVERLQSSRYSEVFWGGGLQNASRIFEVWANTQTGTWTILMTRSDGTSCIMASGTYWRDGNRLLPGVPG